MEFSFSAWDCETVRLWLDLILLRLSLPLVWCLVSSEVDGVWWRERGPFWFSLHASRRPYVLPPSLALLYNSLSSCIASFTRVLTPSTLSLTFTFLPSDYTPKGHLKSSALTCSFYIKKIIIIIIHKKDKLDFNFVFFFLLSFLFIWLAGYLCDSVTRATWRHWKFEGPDWIVSLLGTGRVEELRGTRTSGRQLDGKESEKFVAEFFFLIQQPERSKIFRLI